MLKKMEMVRPTWDEVIASLPSAYIACTCGIVLQTYEQLRGHWQAGHFDYLREKKIGVHNEA